MPAQSLPINHTDLTRHKTTGSWLVAQDPSAVPLSRRETVLENVSVRCQQPLDSMGEMMSDGRFWSDVNAIYNGWISQDSRGLVISRKLRPPIHFEGLIEDLTAWSESRQFQHRLIILIARQERTTEETRQRLQQINQMLQNRFGAMIRLCLVTGSDLLYLRASRVQMDFNHCS